MLPAADQQAAAKCRWDTWLLPRPREPLLASRDTLSPAAVSGVFGTWLGQILVTVMCSVVFGIKKLKNTHGGRGRGGGSFVVWVQVQVPCRTPS